MKLRCGRLASLHHACGKAALAWTVMRGACYFWTPVCVSKIILLLQPKQYIRLRRRFTRLVLLCCRRITYLGCLLCHQAR